MPLPKDILTTDQIRDLEEIAADTTAPTLMRETARRVLADPTRSRQAYAGDLRAAMERLATQIPAGVPLEELEKEVREASEDVRRERRRPRADTKRTGTGG